MFVAKFNQTSGHPFKADKNGNLPFIGEVLAGTAVGTIVNGTMFFRNELQENTLYLCDNYVDPEYPDNSQVKVISEISVMDFIAFKKEFGAGRRVSNVSKKDPVPEGSGVGEDFE